MPSGSVPFDRAAAVYDRTRVTDVNSLRATVDLLDEVIPPGSALEIGVGTGALALPLAARGRRVVGVDLSSPMLERLRDKDRGRRVPVGLCDATRLPFATDAFAGAYCRWVLHLIATWRDAVGELCRVVAPGGVVVVEPGGYSGPWRTVWLRFVEELGEPAAPVGLDVRAGSRDLDEMFAAFGASRRAIISTPGAVDSSLERFLREAAAKSFSWTWRVPDDELARAIEVVRTWALARFGPDLTRPFGQDSPHRWRVYDLGN